MTTRAQRHARDYALWFLTTRIAFAVWLTLVFAAVGMIASPFLPRESAVVANVPPAQSTQEARLVAASTPLPAAKTGPDLTGYLTFQAHVSHYWPALGGVNCSWFVNGVCQAHMADGEPWQDWAGIAVACVPEWPFGTNVVLPGGELFICKDRGGAIVDDANDGLPWIDLLVEQPPVPWGTVVTLRVKFPN